jgi:hypothetical protein
LNENSVSLLGTGNSMVVQCLPQPWQLLTRVTVDSGVMLVIEMRVLWDPQFGHSIRTYTTHPQSAHGEG